MKNNNYSTLAIGDNIVDKYERDNYISAGGNALNFAVYSKMLEAKSSYLGVFGTDNNATFIKNILNEYKIDKTKCKTIDGENGYVSIEMINGERNFLHGNRGGVGKNLTLDNSDLEYIKNFNIINTNIVSHFDILKEIKKIYTVNENIAFDFSIRFDDVELERYAPYIKYALLSTRHISVEETERLLNSIANKYQKIEIIIATRAEEGSIVFSNGKMYYANAIITDNYKDSLGAGDSYFARFLYHYFIDNTNIEAAMVKASEFASYVCTLDGAFKKGYKLTI